MENMNPILGLGELLMLLVGLAMFLGIMLKIGSILLAILAFPAYLALFALESQMIPIKNAKNENILAVNIPEKNPWKLIMNFCASLITLTLLPVFEKLWEILHSSYISSELKLEHLFNGNTQSDLVVITVIFMVSFVGIYLISYFKAEKNDNTPWTKIENLSIPSLWKVIAKGIS